MTIDIVSDASSMCLGDQIIHINHPQRAHNVHTTSEPYMYTHPYTHEIIKNIPD